MDIFLWDSMSPKVGSDTATHEHNRLTNKRKQIKYYSFILQSECVFIFDGCACFKRSFFEQFVSKFALVCAECFYQYSPHMQFSTHLTIYMFSTNHLTSQNKLIIERQSHNNSNISSSANVRKNNNNNTWQDKGVSKNVLPLNVQFSKANKQQQKSGFISIDAELYAVPSTLFFSCVVFSFSLINLMTEVMIHFALVQPLGRVSYSFFYFKKQKRTIPLSPWNLFDRS